MKIHRGGERIYDGRVCPGFLLWCLSENGHGDLPHELMANLYCCAAIFFLWRPRVHKGASNLFKLPHTNAEGPKPQQQDC